MKSTIFLHGLLCLALSFNKSVLSEKAISVVELKNEVNQLKTKVELIFDRQEDLVTKVEFLLQTLTKNEDHTKTFGNPHDITGDMRDQETSRSIAERLDEIERVITEAPEEIGPQVFFGTNGTGLKAFSDVAHDVRTVISSTEFLGGVAYDPVNDMVYYSSFVSIYRTDRHGTSIEIVLNDNTSQYGEIHGLAVDGITGNLYAVSRGGYIFVCGTAIAGQVSCTTIVSSPDGLTGIALSPDDGTMYYTSVAGKMTKANMDGSNATLILSGLVAPAGIVVDYDAARLYWADKDGHRIQSSNVAGGDVRTVVQLPETAGPIGLGLHGNKLYWGNHYAMSLQSSSKTGENVRTLYNATNAIRHLTLATRNFTRTRTNDCKRQACSSICVLRGSSFRCLE